MELRRLGATVRAWLPFVAMCLAASTLAAFLISGTLPKVYEAKATLIVGQSLSGVSVTSDQILVAQRMSSTYASIATTRPNLSAVIDKLGLTMSADDLAQNAAADAALDSTLLTITVHDGDPARAAAIANALAAQLVTVSPAVQGLQADVQQSIDSDLKATQDQINSTQEELASLNAAASPGPDDEARIATLESRLVTLRSTYASLLSYSIGSASSRLTIIEPAEVPTVPVSPRTLLNVLLGGLLGLLVAAMVIAAKEHLDDTIKSPEDVETYVGLPTLGVIGRIPGDRSRRELYRLVAVVSPRSAATESYRMLRANVEFAAVDEPIRTLLITSAVPGEGKTVTSSNLAVVFAQTGRKVLLVDADLRKPGVHNIFQLPNSRGLTTVLRGEAPDAAAALQATEQENLLVLATGPLPANPAELLGSRRMAAILGQLKTEWDLVIIDSPPVQSVADAAILSTLADATILVVGAGRGRRAPVQLGREALERAGARVVGVVLNLLSDPARVGAGDYYPSYAGDDGLPSYGVPSDLRGSHETPPT